MPMNSRVEKSPLVVGLTGGIGAGKSTIVKTLSAMHIPVFDCDAAVAGLYRDPKVITLLEAQYGSMGSDAKATMAALAWQDPAVRKNVEAIFLPRVAVEITAFIDSHVGSPREVVVIDAPTLIEHGFHDIVDWIVVVDAPEATRWQRVKNRAGMTAEKFASVVAAQISDQERRQLAHSTVFNDGEPHQATYQISRIMLQLKEMIRED